MITSVVIPAYNGRQYLAKNLPAVMALGAGELVIVDDASTDGTADFIAQKYPQIKLIRNPINRRFPFTVNTGFSHAKGEIIILINQDVKPDQNLIKHVLPHFANPQIFAVTFNENGRSWADGGWQNGLLEFTNGKLDNRLHESLWPSGGSAAFRRQRLRSTMSARLLFSLSLPPFKRIALPDLTARHALSMVTLGRDS